jgi:hypothetical protein
LKHDTTVIDESKYMPVDEFIRLLENRYAPEGDNWAGIPLPLPGFSMTIHPKYPFAADFGQRFPSDPLDAVEQDEPTNAIEQSEPTNEWYSYNSNSFVGIFHHGDSYHAERWSRHNPVDRILKTLAASNAWDLHAELRAIKKLRRHLNPEKWAQYILTGTFLEQSERSGVVYLFRRLRPTVAMSLAMHRVRILAVLCSHPIGYYSDTWAGAMVPTDDLLAHLLLMRADEHFFWRISNQHPVREMGGLA